MEKLLSVKTAAEHLELTEQTIRRFIRAKKIPFHKLDRVIRFFPSELEEWVKNGMKMKPAETKEKTEEKQV